MCEKCKAAGKGLARVTFELAIELENGVKEVPFRIFGETGESGLHVAYDQAQAKFLKGIMKDLIPILVETFAKGEELETPIRTHSKIVLM